MCACVCAADIQGLCVFVCATVAVCVCATVAVCVHCPYIGAVCVRVAVGNLKNITIGNK